MRTFLMIAFAMCLLGRLNDALVAQGVQRIRGDQSRSLLGDGTDVVVGVIDSGVDATHPALTGVDSKNRNRLVAEANFVTTEPGFSPDDVAGHGTAVAGVIMADSQTVTGLAPDARLINGRAIDSNNSFQTTSWVLNAAGFAVDNGADVMNFSLNTFGVFSEGTLNIDRMIDYAAAERGVISAVCAGNISSAVNGDPTVRSPGGSFNAISVGWTSATNNYDQLHSGSSFGPTDDGRIKPDVVAPGHLIQTLNDDWETQNDFQTWSGCSFATPHVAGMLAQQVDYGKANGLSTDPMALKATMLNSADKNVFDRNGGAWQAFSAADVAGVYTVTSGMDEQLGAGQIDGVNLYHQYSAGEQEAGMVSAIGWDLDLVSDGETLEYDFDHELAGGTHLTATLTWFRDVAYTDDGDGTIDSGDAFIASALDDLSLSLLLDGQLVAIANSAVDNVEHLFFELPETGNYRLVVERLNGIGSSTDFAIAWSATAVPEPGLSMFGLFAFTTLMFNRRKRLN